MVGNPNDRFSHDVAHIDLHTTDYHTRVVCKVLGHSLFCQKDRTSVETTYMVTNYYIYVILG